MVITMRLVYYLFACITQRQTESVHLHHHDDYGHQEHWSTSKHIPIVWTKLDLSCLYILSMQVGVTEHHAPLSSPDLFTRQPVQDVVQDPVKDAVKDPKKSWRWCWLQATNQGKRCPSLHVIFSSWSPSSSKMVDEKRDAHLYESPLRLQMTCLASKQQKWWACEAPSSSMHHFASLKRMMIIMIIDSRCSSLFSSLFLQSFNGKRADLHVSSRFAFFVIPLLSVQGTKICCPWWGFKYMLKHH